MNIIDQLGDIYTDIDNSYASIEATARAREHYKKEAKYQRKRELNDQAYFLFMFTRLEDRIKELSTNLIDHKSATLTNYKNKRVWEIIKQRNDTDRLTLMEKVSFLTQFNGADYHLILGYKRQRDTIAHGGIVPAINMTAVINDMTRLYQGLNN